MNQCKEGMLTPWGAADSAEKLCDDIWQVGTPSHGGVKVYAKKNRLIPEYMRKVGGWYEEDCDWCIPFTIFASEILVGGDEYAIKEIVTSHHILTLRNWFPFAYEKYFDITLAEGESHRKDEDIFLKRHENDFLVWSAVGSWHKDCPSGYALVWAKRHDEEKQFLIPAEEYKTRENLNFVVDTEKHQEFVAGE